MAALSMDIYLPSLPAIEQEFFISEEWLQLSISLFLWSFAFTQLVAGLLSDRFGRKITFGFGLVLYLGGSLACAFAPNFYWLLAARFLQGVGACVGPVTALAISRDLLPEKERARALSFIASAMALAPILAPLIGSVLESFFNWRASFYFLVAFALLLLALIKFLPETLKHSQSIHWRPVAKAYAEILKSRTWHIHSWLAACSFSAMFLWISASSLYLIKRLDYSEIEFALFFGVSASCFMLSAFLNSKLVKTVATSRLLLMGTLSTVSGGFLMLSLSVLELSAWRLWGPSVLLSFGIGFVLPNTNAAAMSPFPFHAGKAAAMTNFLRLVIAGLAVTTASVFYDASGFALSMAVFGFGVMQSLLWFLTKRFQTGNTG